jgi:hypothetical protein
MNLAEIEERLKALERMVAELQDQNGRNRRWWVDDAGRFPDDPIFEEIVALGRTYRRSLRPRRSSRSRAK